MPWKRDRVGTQNSVCVCVSVEVHTTHCADWSTLQQAEGTIQQCWRYSQCFSVCSSPQKPAAIILYSILYTLTWNRLLPHLPSFVLDDSRDITWIQQLFLRGNTMCSLTHLTRPSLLPASARENVFCIEPAASIPFLFSFSCKMKHVFFLFLSTGCSCYVTCWVLSNKKGLWGALMSC